MAQQQVDILKLLYSQQQSTAHILRERMAKISTGVISLFIVIDGWIFSNTEIFSESESQVSTLIIAVIVTEIAAIYAIHSRYKEFCAVAKLIVRIEIAMKIYETGAFIENETLYPEEFKALGSEDYEHGKNILLSQIYILLIFGALSVGLAILV